MKCKDAERLIQRSLDGDLSPAERTTLDAHMEGCASCREAWEQYRALARTATRWVDDAVQDPGDDFTMRVMREIAGLADAAAPRIMPSRRSILAGFGAGAVVFAVAACVIALLGVGLHDLVRAAPELPSLSSVGPPTWASARGAWSDWASGLQTEISRAESAGASTWLIYVFVAALAGNIALAGSILRRRRAM